MRPFSILSLSLLLSASIVQSCADASVITAEEAAAPSGTHRRSAFIPGSVIIEVSEELAADLSSGTPCTRSSALNDTFGSLGVVSIERLYPDAGEWEPRHREAGLHRWFRIEYDPSSAVSTRVASNLSSIPGIESARPERRIVSTAFFNDPMADQQWALYNHGRGTTLYSEGCDVNVQTVWDNYTAGNPDVIVAVLDLGVQLDHPDLVASTIPAGENGSRSFVYKHTGFHITPGDHGTHVAGIIGATNNNGQGISSIAGGRDVTGGVKILSCAIMMDDPDKPDETLSGNIPDAIVWAADHGAIIANNSWSFVYESEEEALQGDASYVEPAINYFIKNAGCDLSGKQAPGSPMKGGVLIFAAGNESYRIGWPAALESVIAVGALNSMYQPAYYTNFGDWVDICAPGGDLKLGPGILSTLSDSKYGSLQGTSMACPHVAGVAALIASHFGGPGFTPDMLKERLLEGANKTKAPKNIGPIVDALGSFAYGGTIDPDPVSNLTADVSANTITMTWDVSADEDDVKALGYLMLLSRDREVLETVKPKRTIPLSVSQKKVENGTARIGETVSGMFEKLDFETEYYVTVFAYDYLGHYSTLSDIVSVRTGVNNPPVIELIDTGEFAVKAFQEKSIRFDVYDPDSHNVIVTCKSGSDALSIAKEGRTVKAIVTGIAAPAGVYDAVLTATDEFGASSSFNFSYRILENHPPQLFKDLDNIMFDSVGETVTLYIPDYIIDEDEEPLTYAIESSAPKVAEATPNGDHVKIRAAGYGLATITITGTDVSKSSSTLTFKVLVRDASRPVELYPNPVKTKLYLRTLEEGMLETTISNRAGATVYSGSAESTPFNPVEIDMSGMPSGSYYVRLKGCGLDGRYTIVKI